MTNANELLHGQGRKRCIIIIIIIIIISSSLSSVVFCCIDILSLCLYSSLSSAARWVQQSHHNLPNRIAFEFFSSVSLVYLSAFHNFMQKSVTSQNMANPSMFRLPNGVQYLPVFVYSPGNFLISNIIKPTDLFHFSISKFLLLSVCVNVHVSAAYSATLQTKYFIILFFSSRFVLSVNNFIWV